MNRKIQSLTLTAVAASLTAMPALAEKVADRYTFDVAAGETLIVDLADANVDIETGRGSGVTVEFVLDGNMSRARQVYDDLNFRAAESSEGVRVSSDRMRAGGWGWNSWSSWSITARVRVPSSFNLDVRTGDGNVELSDDLDGDVQIVTGDGNIVLRTIRGGSISLRTGDGNLETDLLDASDVAISTGDGNVEVAGLVAGEASVRTGDGNIEISGIDGAIDATTGDGNIALRFESFAGASARTGDGDVDIRAPSEVSAALSLRGEDVTLVGETSSFRGERRDQRVEGELNGGGPQLRAATGDGDVTLRLDER